jgi:hypothetical protein
MKVLSSLHTPSFSEERFFCWRAPGFARFVMSRIEYVGWMSSIGGKPGERAVPVSICAPNIACGLPRHWNRDAGLRDGPRTGWAMARFFHLNNSCVFCVLYWSVTLLLLWFTVFFSLYCTVHCSCIVLSACDVRAATLTEVFPCFFLICNANVRV